MFKAGTPPLIMNAPKTVHSLVYDIGERKRMLDGKKCSILLVLEILKEYSDKDHFLTQQAIIDKIESRYGLSFERKSISDCIKLLQELDYDIEKGPRGGYALISRLLDPSEVQFVTDALFSSRSIPGKAAAELARSVQSTLSVHQRANYNYIYKTPQITRTDSKEVFWAIDTMHEAIRQGKRISFQYKTYDEHGKETLRNDGYRYIVSPYYLVSNNGFYYLLCNYREKYRPINLFRLDCLTNLQIEPEWPIKPLATLEGAENFDIASYLNEHLYMLGGDTVDASLRIEQPNGIQYLKDWFGTKARLVEKDGVLLAKIKCNENSLFYWILQYGDEFTLLEPEGLVQRLREHLKRQNEKYS